MALRGSEGPVGLVCLFLIFFKNVSFYLFIGCASSQLRHVGSSSLTRNRTQGPCIRSKESKPLDYQASPLRFGFMWVKRKAFPASPELESFDPRPPHLPTSPPPIPGGLTEARGPAFKGKPVFPHPYLPGASSKPCWSLQPLGIVRLGCLLFTPTPEAPGSHLPALYSA